MSTLDPQRLLSRLEGIIPAGEGKWYARCPAHADRSPSLSIRDTGDKLLLHCFAGCDATDILTAIGLTWADLYPDPWECAWKRPNEAAQKTVKRLQAASDPLEIERTILLIAAAQLRAGQPLSLEDAARVEVARQRVQAG